jgi:MFS family permease
VFAAGLGAFMVLADFTTLAVAGSVIRGEFGTADAAAPWLVGGFALALAALLLPAGVLVDRWGLKRTYLVGLAGFTAASLICVAAPNMPGLILARVLQGAAAAAVLAPAISLLHRARREQGRPPAFAVWGAVAAAAAVIGPISGAGLIEFLGWRFVFIVEILVAMLAFALGAIVMSESRDTGEGRFELRLLARPGFAGAALATSVMSVAAFAGLVFTSDWVQEAHGLSPLKAAVALLPLAVGAWVAAVLLLRSKRKVPPWIGVGLGLALVGVGGFLQTALTADWRSSTAGLLVAGIGVGLCVPALNAAVPKDREIAASLALNASAQAGLALGILVLGAVFAVNYDGFIVDALEPTMRTAGAIALIGAIPAAFFVSRSSRRSEHAKA